MDVARLTGAARMCPQSNKSILPTFVLSKVGTFYEMEKQSHCKTRTCRHSIFYKTQFGQHGCTLNQTQAFCLLLCFQK